MVNFEKFSPEKSEKEIIDRKIPFDEGRFYHFKVREIRERESRRRLNLDWLAEIYLKDEEDNILIDFKKDILPEGWQIEAPIYPSWYCQDKDKKVMVPQTFSHPQEIISFLHEAGHSHTDLLLTDQEKRMISRTTSVWSEMEDIKKMLKKEQEAKQIEHILSRHQQLKDIWQKENLDKGIKALAKIERMAWAWAFKKVREIKKVKKIDLLKPFKIWTPEMAEDWRRKNWQEVRNYVHSQCLSTYEKAAFDQVEGRLKGYFSKENYPKPFKK